MKTRLRNIFKTTNTKTLIKAILKKPRQASAKTITNNYLKTAHTFFKGYSICRYFLNLDCYNFGPALTKSVKLRFLEIT